MAFNSPRSETHGTLKLRGQSFNPFVNSFYWTQRALR
jgi:hypothetical protein